MKNKEFHKNREFRPFRIRILIQTSLLILTGAAIPVFLYMFLGHGRVANWTVAAFQEIFRLDYDAAVLLYHNSVRRHQDSIIWIIILLTILIIFMIYLNWFTKYFVEINKGMDSLLKEDAGEISLSPEMLPLERKMNTVKHTIERQKNEMLESEKRKNDLIMYLAHDLKTPLASVIGYLNLLRDERQISKELSEKYLSISLAKAERLEELINEFFEIARFQLSDITLQYSQINLTRLLEQLVYEFSPMLKEENLECRLCAGDDIMINCDSDKIERVFDNLFRNAVNYSYGGTEIEVTAKRCDENAVISFRNHGDTIPEDKLERLFEQFYRLDSSRGTGKGGAGLGLSIARQIVTLHRGTITASSSDGTTELAVTLPLAVPENQRSRFSGTAS